MRRRNMLQRLLYGVMVVLGVYIAVKGGRLLQKKIAGDGSGAVQRTVEDAAMRTWAAGYTAAVEGKKSGNWLADWMRQVVPVFSYLADNETEEPDASEAETAAETDGMQTDAQAKTEEAQSAAQTEEAQQVSEAETEETQQASVSAESGAAEKTEEPSEETETDNLVQEALQEVMAQAADFDWLTANYYTIDAGTKADAALLDGEKLLSEDLSLEQNSGVPQILIYHTHSQEAFADSAEGRTEDTIVGMGEILADELRGYGYQVIHDTGVYDLVDGVLDRSAAYDYAREAVEALLLEYPTIEVILDLHRDGVDGEKPVTEIDGEQTAMIMFFNGISRDENGAARSGLENPYLEQNLAFSLQLEVLARQEYPGFTRNIYLKGERFNLHLRPRSLLVEAGTQLNTVEEERNAMKPLASLLHQVLSASLF